VLTAFQTISTLPDDFQGSNTCSQIQISSSGGFLYAPNRGHDSIACFRVEASGELVSIGNVSTEATPRAFSLDSQGRFLFAAGLDSGRLAAYRIDGDTGELELIEVYDVGEEPMWVLAIGPTA
jgi:6-phosphogluconolactonase